MISPGTSKSIILKIRLVDILFILLFRDRILARKIFAHDLPIMVVRGSFSVGIYKYARPGSLSDWIVVLKVMCGAS